MFAMFNVAEFVSSYQTHLGWHFHYLDEII